MNRLLPMLAIALTATCSYSMTLAALGPQDATVGHVTYRSAATSDDVILGQLLNHHRCDTNSGDCVPQPNRRCQELILIGPHGSATNFCEPG